MGFKKNSNKRKIKRTAGSESFFKNKYINVNYEEQDRFDFQRRVELQPAIGRYVVCQSSDVAFIYYNKEDIVRLVLKNIYVAYDVNEEPIHIDHCWINCGTLENYKKNNPFILNGDTYQLHCKVVVYKAKITTRLGLGSFKYIKKVSV